MRPPPVTFELKVREQNQLGFWNISITPLLEQVSSKSADPHFQPMTLK